MSLNSIVALDAMALSTAISAGELTSTQVMSAYLDHIAACNPAVNAIVAIRPAEELMAEAAALDDEFARSGPRGWMHGFPAAVKDLEAVAGLPFTQGSPIFKDRVAGSDCIHASRMRASGAIMIGKTNTPEFGLGSNTYNPVYGITRNPYDNTLTAGGSSGGAAASLALRMLPVADGTDHAGSLRNPAGFNNVFGLRPSFGRVPDVASDVFSTALGVAGPMARNARDLAMLLSVQAGSDPRSPLSIRQSPTIYSDIAKAPALSLTGKRIAWLADLHGHLPMEEGVLTQCEEALKVFESLGCEVDVVSKAAMNFPVEEIFTQWLALRAWTIRKQLQPLYDDPVRRAMLKPEAIWEIEAGHQLTLHRLAQAEAFRNAWFTKVRQLHSRFDVIALPSAQVFPFTAETTWPREVAGRKMDTYHRWMEVVLPGTMSGCPVVSVPAGFGERGLPMGMQLIAPIHREDICLNFAIAYDEATHWAAKKLPPAIE